MFGVGSSRGDEMENRCFPSLLLLFYLCFAVVDPASAFLDPSLGTTRVVFQICLLHTCQKDAVRIFNFCGCGGSYFEEYVELIINEKTNYGDIEFGFFPNVAPKTVEHIFKLVRLGCYNTNHFFRVDKGFVAQVAAVVGGRSVPLNEEQKLEAEKTVIGEFSEVKHVRGILSMGRYSDPDSASSSFSILLGDAPHLDGKYAIFGKLTRGDETLRKLEELPTRREGIFVMPTERITIMSTYFYDTKYQSCEQEKEILKRKLSESLLEVERQRLKCFS